MNLRSAAIGHYRTSCAIDAIERGCHLEQLGADWQKFLVKDLSGNSAISHRSIPNRKVGAADVGLPPRLIERLAYGL